MYVYHEGIRISCANLESQLRVALCPFNNIYNVPEHKIYINCDEKLLGAQIKIILRKNKHCSNKEYLEIVVLEKIRMMHSSGNSGIYREILIF